MKHVQILIFDDVEELDFAGPYEVFAYLRQTHPDLCTLELVSENGQPVRCAKKLKVNADSAITDAAKPDILIVPGGYGARQIQVNNPVMINYLQKAASHTEIIASVCTGAFLLHKAGLLSGLKVTTHWRYRDMLAALGQVQVLRERYVDQGKIITAAGVSAGIDMSLHITERIWGRDIAAQIQSGIEYFPAPPDLGVTQP